MLSLQGPRPPAHWSRVVTMDYADAGYKASLITAVDPWERFAVTYSAWKETGKEISQQVDAAKRVLGQRAEDPSTIWIVDKSAPLIEYIKAGAPVIKSLSGPGQKAWLISQANELLFLGRLFVVREPCAPLLAEAKRFVRKPESDRAQSDERKAGAVVKRDDHLCDCFLYLAGYLSLFLSDAKQPIAEQAQRPWPPPPQPIKEMKATWRGEALQGVDAILDYLNFGI